MTAGTPEWVTSKEARIITGRSARTLRLWRSQGLIRIKMDAHRLLMWSADLYRVEAAKSEYRTHPTFGR